MIRGLLFGCGVGLVALFALGDTYSSSPPHPQPLLNVMGSGTGPTTSQLGAFGSQQVVARASSKYCPNADGTLTSLGSNVGCVEPGAVTGGLGGMQVENGATNLLLNTEDLTAVAWAGVGVSNSAPTVTGNVGSTPVTSQGTVGTQVAVPAVSAGASFLAQTVMLAAATSSDFYSLSIYLKGTAAAGTTYLAICAWDVIGGDCLADASAWYARAECKYLAAWSLPDGTGAASRCTLDGFLLPAAGTFGVFVGVDLRDARQASQAARSFIGWGAMLIKQRSSTTYAATTFAAETLTVRDPWYYADVRAWCATVYLSPHDGYDSNGTRVLFSRGTLGVANSTVGYHSAQNLVFDVYDGTTTLKRVQAIVTSQDRNWTQATESFTFCDANGTLSIYSTDRSNRRIKLTLSSSGSGTGIMTISTSASTTTQLGNAVGGGFPYNGAFGFCFSGARAGAAGAGTDETTAVNPTCGEFGYWTPPRAITGCTVVPNNNATTVIGLMDSMGIGARTPLSILGALQCRLGPTKKVDAYSSATGIPASTALTRYNARTATSDPVVKLLDYNGTKTGGTYSGSCATTDPCTAYTSGAQGLYTAVHNNGALILDTTEIPCASGDTACSSTRINNLNTLIVSGNGSGSRPDAVADCNTALASAGNLKATCYGSGSTDPHPNAECARICADVIYTAGTGVMW